VFEAPVGNVQGDEGNDVLQLMQVPPSDNLAAADGGSGNDVLVVERNEGAPDPPPSIGLRAWYLAGADGNDVLLGGSGPDVFVGGAAADLLFARDGLAEEMRCGDGFDVAFVDPEDTVSRRELAVPASNGDAVRTRAAIQCAASRPVAAAAGLRRAINAASPARRSPAGPGAFRGPLG
jgi:Ca2+-binding RTX toxin-like protein